MPPKNYNEFKDIMAGNTLKATGQRYIIYKYLQASRRHPSADQVWKALQEETPAIARDTVYRTLNGLCLVDLAQKVALPGGAIHYDGNISPHQHFFCEACSMIYDFFWPSFENMPLPRGATLLGRTRRRSALIVGLCLACQNEGAASL